jgi:hypothetical protein
MPVFSLTSLIQHFPPRNRFFELEGNLKCEQKNETITIINVKRWLPAFITRIGLRTWWTRS